MTTQLSVAARNAVLDAIETTIGTTPVLKIRTGDKPASCAAADAGTVVCTRSGHDVVLVRGEEQAVVPVNRVVPVDATGAGDQFAAGFIYGLATGVPLAVAGRMGCVAAAEVIGHFGARPETDVMALFRKAGLV